MHIRAKATLVCATLVCEHTWVLTSHCVLDTVWMIHILDPQPLPSHSHTLSCYLASIPLGCHGVPMATYIYTTWLWKSADLSLAAAVDFGCTHTKSEWPREREEKQKWSEHWRHMSQVKHLFAVARHTASWFSICLDAHITSHVVKNPTPLQCQVNRLSDNASLTLCIHTTEVAHHNLTTVPITAAK